MKLYSNINQTRIFLRQTGLRPRYFLVPVFLGFGASLFEGVNIGLLLPLVQGIVHLNFSVLKEMPILGTVLLRYPDVFNSNTSIFVFLLLLVTVTASIKYLLQYSASVTMAYISRQFTNNLRQLIFSRYLSFGKLYFDRSSTGSLHQILVQFTQALAFSLMQFNGILTNFFMLLVYIVVLFFISWKLTLLAMLIFPAMNFMVKWLIEKIKKTSMDMAAAYTELGREIFNVLTCIPLVKAYTREEEEKRQFAKISDRVQMFDFSIDKKSHLINPIQEMIMMSAVLVLISFMAVMVVRGGGQAAVASFLVFFYTLRRAAMSFGVFNQAKAVFAGIQGPLSAIREILEDDGKYFIPDGEVKFCGLRHGIHFKNVCFFYLAEQPVLKNVDLFFEKNKTTAIVGPTGAGKTTIANLILRFYDVTDGEILVDGVNIKQFMLKSLRNRMAIVSQDIQLFNDTLRENITYGLDEELTEERIFDAIQKARLSDFIKKLPNGLETLIGDRGVLLSGGEKQRVSIARALLRDAEIMIMDEATSSLDSETERLIQEAVSDLMKGKTSVVIAHRLSTIKNADKVMVVEDGQKVEEGTLAELLRKKRRFFHYWEQQKFY